MEAHRLVKNYGNVEAVRGVDLPVARGEVFGFLGPNGAGKTAGWGVVYSGFMQLIALKTRSAAATQSGRVDLRPAALPRRVLAPPRPHGAHGDVWPRTAKPAP